MRQQDIEDIQSVIDYNFDTEERDYAENPSPDHIFLSLQRLKALVSRES